MFLISIIAYQVLLRNKLVNKSIIIILTKN